MCMHVCTQAHTYTPIHTCMYMPHMWTCICGRGKLENPTKELSLNTLPKNVYFCCSDFISYVETTFHIQSDVESLLTGQHLTEGRNSCSRTTFLPWSSLRAGTVSTAFSVTTWNSEGPQEISYLKCSEPSEGERKSEVKRDRGRGQQAFLVLFIPQQLASNPTASRICIHSFCASALLDDHVYISFSFWKWWIWIQVVRVRMTNSIFPSLLDKYTTTTLLITCLLFDSNYHEIIIDAFSCYVE